MSSQSVSADEPFRKLLLSFGFVALAGGVLVAHRTPATGYELSIYTMTSPWIWAGLGTALLVSLAVSFAPSGADGWESRSFALVLGGLAITAFAGLPIIRGYHFFGHHDALTHLGWAQGIADGTISPFDLLYPGIHTLSVLINSVTGIPLSSSMLLVVLLSTVAFVIFVPLSVGTVVPDQLAVTIAAFGAFLLLPVTTISTFMQPHAMTQTILLFALFVYVLLKYLVSDGASGGLAFVFAIVAAAAVVFHPQYVAHVLVVCLAICGLQLVVPRIPFVSRTRPVRRIAGHRRLYGHTLLLVAVFLLWSANHGFFSGFVDRALTSAIEYILTGSGEAGASISAQGGSLAAIGVSLTEIFVKLFFPHLVFAALTGLLVLAVVLTGRPRRYRDVSAVTIYLAAGLCGLGLLFVVYFVSVTNEMYFRVFGLIAVFTVILGSIALHAGILSLSERLSTRSVRTIAVGLFAVLLVLSLASVFASPYVYSQSHHVSSAQMGGYESAFDAADPDVEFAGFGGAPNRYADAIYAAETRTGAHATVTTDTFESGPAEYYGTDRYLVISEIDHQRETVAYQGLHYSESDFASLDADPNIDRVQSNGEVTTYRVRT
ncbi:MFS transporter [Natrarchaeobius halalkaliphilus]|uniref:MFS transporter n=1 Tax=Natrarchaeobius halalkaliphilus TaxID=1679091 RepID=A0A3N6LSD7_9EURY|nr:MFS transporter [Natrarchaeobius halalkaliphilus]RQG90184.1 MFS transporter [Natrarchaeobius halalkaliphilus]